MTYTYWQKINIECLTLALSCLVAFTSAFQRDLVSCPAGYDVILPHEECNKFYQCVGQYKVAQSCPDGLMFNVYTNRCDWPQNVNCERNKIDNAEKARTFCLLPQSDGALLPHNNCHQFYECANGVPVAMTCPKNLYFNHRIEQCDWAENVQCSFVPVSEDLNEKKSPLSPEEICAAPDSNGLLVTHENCQQFYKCSEGVPVTMTCPSGLLYNSKIQQCDWPENVKCGNDINSDPSQAEAICAEPNADGVLIAHENCNQFYKCSDGVPIALACPPNLQFNPDNNQCDWLENVNCKRNENNIYKDVTIDLSQASICASPESNGLLVAHENCNQFYECSEGVPVPMICPNGLLFNPKSNQCDWPENVNCNGNNDSGSGSDYQELAQIICSVEQSEGVMALHEVCSQFYKCSNGVPVPQSCPADLYFNPDKAYCDWLENVECGDRKRSIKS